VTADHGEEFQEHGNLVHGSHLYDEQLHVPLVIAGSAVAAGRNHVAAQGIDVFPTVVARLGLAPPAGLPGRDLLAPHEERPVFSETRGAVGPNHESMQLLSVRSRGWKLIHAPTLGRFELYDLEHDPAERDDRFTTSAETASLAALLTGWEENAPPPPPVAGHDPALGQKLRALGYVD
jgi:arylsulfatase A-like enzyme